MTASQSIDFYSDRAKKAWDATRIAVDTGNFYLLTLNLNSALESHLMVALLQWRQGEVSPESSIKKAFDTVINGLPLIEDIDGDYQIWKNFNYFPAGYCGILLGETLELPLKEAIIGCQGDSGDHLTQCLDACILNTIQFNKLPETWDTLLAKFSENRRYNLLINTYKTYADIILIGRREKSELASLVEKSARLYLDRRKDEYFSGGLCSFGGGPDNQLVVDYRCAALIEYCIDLEIDDLSETARPHYWKW